MAVTVPGVERQGMVGGGRDWRTAEDPGIPGEPTVEAVRAVRRAKVILEGWGQDFGGAPARVLAGWDLAARLVQRALDVMAAPGAHDDVGDRELSWGEAGADPAPVAGVALSAGRVVGDVPPVPIDVRCGRGGCRQRMRGELAGEYVERGLRAMVRGLGWRWEDGPAGTGPLCPEHAPVPDGSPCWRPERHGTHRTYRGYPGQAVPIREWRCPGREVGPEGIPVSRAGDDR